MLMMTMKMSMGIMMLDDPMCENVLQADTLPKTCMQMRRFADGSVPGSRSTRSSIPSGEPILVANSLRGVGLLDIAVASMLDRRSLRPIMQTPCLHKGIVNRQSLHHVAIGNL